MSKVNEEIKPTGDGARLERQRALNARVARLLEPELPEFDPDCPLLLLEPPKLSPKRGWLHVHIYDHGDVCEWEPQPFSESMAAAMEAVEHFESEGWRISLNSSPHAPRTLRWRVDLFKERFPREENVSVSELSETLPEAICLAALSAKAAEVSTT